MGIFTRLRDIINSNLNAMLDKAEDPEKLLRLMLREMEDTLIELKAQCASAMAQSKTIQRAIDELRDRANDWAAKARLAVEKGREVLAREALLEKRRLTERIDPQEAQKAECEALIDKYQEDIAQLEGKIQSLRERQKVLVQRYAHAQSKKRAEETIRSANGTETMSKIDLFERRLDRMEAEAEMVNYGVQPSVEQQFKELESDEDLERELEELRKQVKG
ncbi:MAG TPA: phage shock protein PspA [Candidatus Sumerlaeota bacterium]|nr:phage shock protein PspA [Candidatus Sumerlaeota bacterium]HPS00713.1 phage shock protein PspA [Candidatus Sumerlaeota bacterium]